MSGYMRFAGMATIFLAIAGLGWMGNNLKPKTNVEMWLPLGCVQISPKPYAENPDEAFAFSQAEYGESKFVFECNGDKYEVTQKVTAKKHSFHIDPAAEGILVKH